MSFGKDFGLGFSTYFKAVEFIFKNGLWYYFVFPVLLVLMLTYGGYELWQASMDWIQGVVEEWLGVASTEGGEELSTWGAIWEGIKGFFSTAAKSLISIILSVLFALIYYVSIKYIVLILLSPVLAFLSEKTEKILTGNDYPFNFEYFAKDVMRGVLVALRNMTFEFMYIFLCFILTWFVPILGFITPIFLFVIASYFYGFAFMDYAVERRRLSIGEGARLIRKHKGIAIANGSLYTIVFWIPVFGLIFAPIVGVVGATIALHERIDLGTNTYAKKEEPVPPKLKA